MAIPYKIVSKKAPGSDELKYYPTLTQRQVVGLRKISDIVSDRSTFTSSDVYGMAEALLEVIPALLLKGHSVRLGGLGIFSLSVKAEGEDQPKDVDKRNIKEVRLNFRTDNQVKERLQLAAFKKVE